MNYREALAVLGPLELGSSRGLDRRRLAQSPRLTIALYASVCARVRSLRVLDAIQAHVPAAGKEVPKLSELGLPVEATTDPFNGEPLHVKRTPQGWLVYSVGKNLRDDGGKLDDDSDVGVGPLIPAARPAEK
jgi:hypothetical protein